MLALLCAVTSQGFLSMAITLAKNLQLITNSCSSKQNNVVFLFLLVCQNSMVCGTKSHLAFYGSYLILGNTWELQSLVHLLICDCVCVHLFPYPLTLAFVHTLIYSFIFLFFYSILISQDLKFTIWFFFQSTVQ